MNLDLLKSRWHIYFGSFVIALFLIFVIYNNYINLNINSKSLPSDIYFNHYHGIEEHENNYYVIREFERETENWHRELWKYDKKTLEGNMIYRSKGIDFRADPQEKYVALNTEINNLKILDLKTREIVFEQIEKDEYPAIGLEKWADNGKYFWFTKSLGGPGLDSLHKLNINNFQIENFDLQVSEEYDLNPNTEMLVYSDCPTSYDIFGFFEIANEKEQINLFIHDLKTKTSKHLVSQRVGRFMPKWINNKKIEYTEYPLLNKEMIDFLEELEIKIMSGEDYEINEIKMYEIYNNWEKDKIRKRIEIE